MSLINFFEDDSLNASDIQGLHLHLGYFILKSSSKIIGTELTEHKHRVDLQNKAYNHGKKTSY